MSYIYSRSTHAACHAATNLTFRSCTVLSSSSPVFEASKLNCHYQDQESVSDSISVIEAPASMYMYLSYRSCMQYIDDLYHIVHHENYAATGDIVKFFIIIMIFSTCMQGKYKGQSSLVTLWIILAGNNKFRPWIPS